MITHSDQRRRKENLHLVTADYIVQKLYFFAIMLYTINSIIEDTVEIGDLASMLQVNPKQHVGYIASRKPVHAAITSYSLAMSLEVPILQLESTIWRSSIPFSIALALLALHQVISLSRSYRFRIPL
jgi:hypothetical protein